MLPTFLGIGVPRGGSTWLHYLLASHPDVFMPIRRKEVQFFDQHYERGLEWYEAFFPSSDEALEYKAVGEITPQYYRRHECPERIFRTMPESKLIIILRNPVDRLYSHYGYWVQRRHYKGSFGDFLTLRPEVVEFGYYCRHIERYLRYFDRGQLLILVFEYAVANVARTKEALADFLAIPSGRFPPVSGSTIVNASAIGNANVLYSFAAAAAKLLRRCKLERGVDFARQLGIERLFAKGDPLPPLNSEMQKRLSDLYREDSMQLERRFHIDLSCWQR